MTLRVVFRRAARVEFDAAALWYEERQIGLGATFTSEIKRAVELASDPPERFPVKLRNSLRSGSPLSLLRALSFGSTSDCRVGGFSRAA